MHFIIFVNVGTKDLDVSKGSADFKELEEIDRRINELGFGKQSLDRTFISSLLPSKSNFHIILGLPAGDKISGHGDDYNDSYADDFHPRYTQHSHNIHITFGIITK